MGGEWRNVFHRFDGFIAALHPTHDDLFELLAAAKEAAAILRAVYAAGDELELHVIGSVAKGTAVHRLAAIDVLAIVQPDPKPAALVAALAARFGEVRGTAAGAISIAAKTEPSHDVRVDIYPAALGARGLAPFGHSASTRFDPDAESQALANANLMSGQKACHLIMMLKVWRDAQGLALPSLVLDALVEEFVRIWLYNRRSFLFYDWMIRDFFFWLCYQAGRDVALFRSGERLPIGRDWVDAAETAYATAVEACRLERLSADQAARDRWGTIFGDRFLAVGDVEETPWAGSALSPSRPGLPPPAWAVPQRL